ncbi:MAG TPA: biotin transporter BioY [Clostridiaceae bacterium]|nr:biotin transporter BioY [Clostridiaceae bacterium]
MKVKVTTRMMTYAALFGVLTFVFGFIRIPVGPVPITLQTLAVLMAGLLLKPATSCLAMLLHAFLKIILGGSSPFVSPGFGFVLAFVVASPLLSFLTQRNKGNCVRTALNIAAVTFLIYILGLPYMALVLRFYLNQTITFGNILMTGMVVFLPGDALKAVTAWFLAYRLTPFSDKTGTT